MISKYDLVLVSESPQRIRLLKQIEPDFEITSPLGEEVYDDSLSAQKQIEQIAYQKALSVAHIYPDSVLIAADTVIVHNGDILGKPEDETDAFNMLKRLTGETHHVITGVCLMSSNLTDIFSVITEVTFKPMSDQEIETYVATGEPMNRSGSYSIQSDATTFVEEVNGDIDSVVGFPVTEVSRRLNNQQF